MSRPTTHSPLSFLHQRRRSTARIIANALLIAVSACGGTDAAPPPTQPTTPPPPVAVASVTLDQTTASLTLGDSVLLVATARDATGTALAGREITWSSNAPAVATVNAGRVVAVGVGAATISVASEGRTVTANIVVTPMPVATIVLSASDRSLLVGARDTLTATTRAANGATLADRPIVWSSANAAIASVANGIVTAVSPGTTTISATSEGRVATAAIIVRALSCASTVPVGRLTRAPNGGAFHFTTAAGWTIRIDQTSMLIRGLDSTGAYEYWGSTHESLRGKHIKDILEHRRSLVLSGSTLVTIDITPRAVDPSPQAWVNYVSIYDGNETHRIDMQTYAVVQSCLLPRFGEADEHDGETAELREAPEGLYFNNIYTQGVSSSGIPLVKVLNLVPLGFADYVRRNNVTDFFDDPRFGHT